MNPSLRQLLVQRTAPDGRIAPEHRRDERVARQVEAMSGYGLPIRHIARVVGVGEDLLREHYQDELLLGEAKANAKVIESLFRKATGDGQGAVAAAIFWAKTRCGWKETYVTEVSGPDGGPIQSVAVSARERLALMIDRIAERNAPIVDPADGHAGVPRSPVEQ